MNVGNEPFYYVGDDPELKGHVALEVDVFRGLWYKMRVRSMPSDELHMPAWTRTAEPKLSYYLTWVGFRENWKRKGMR